MQNVVEACTATVLLRDGYKLYKSAVDMISHLRESFHWRCLQLLLDSLLTYRLPLHNALKSQHAAATKFALVAVALLFIKQCADAMLCAACTSDFAEPLKPVSHRNYWHQ
jgi:hypothetical protein